jgi:ADP-ribose pyrophosphatase
MSTIHTTPGFTDEVIHLFLATELVQGVTDHGPSEFIELHRMPLARAVEMIDLGEITDAKTICALTLAAREVSGAE